MTHNNRITLNDLFHDWVSGSGFMSILTANNPVPWSGTIQGDVLDLDYHGNRSGNKLVAPLLVNLISNSEISTANKIKVSKLVYTKYGQNWGKLWDTLSFDYDPISNYDSTETETISNTNTGNTATTTSNTESGSVASNSTNNETSNGTSSLSTAEKKNGYNTTTATNTGETSNSGTTSSTTNGTSSNTTTTSGQNNGTNETESTYTDNTTRTTRRHGNIGVTTSQQMIQSERDLWLWNFFEQVFSDIDSVLVTKVYGETTGNVDFVGVRYTLPTATDTTLGGVKIGSGIDVTSDGTISTERDWELVATITDTYDITIDLTGKKELIVYGLTTGTGASNLYTNFGTICSGVVGSGTRKIFSHHKDIYTFIEPLSARYSSATTATTLGSTMTGYAFVGKNISEITRLYFNNPSNVTSCDIKIYAR